MISLTLIGCRKDPVLDTCEEIPPSEGIGWGYNYQLEENYYTKPEFNPNSGDEILFVEDDVLYKFNLVTLHKTQVYDGQLYSQPSWGANGWILFSKSDNNIWKIRPDGSNLTQLTIGGSNPKWNYNATRFMYTGSGGNIMLVIRDSNNNYIDSIYNGSGGYWNHPDNLIADAATGKEDGDNWIHGVEIVDPEMDQIIYTYYLTTAFSHLGSGGEIWLGDGNTVVWSCLQGIFKTNYITNTTEKITNSCNTSYYLYPSYSPQSDKIIWQHVEQTLIDQNNISVKSSIVIMNSDGTSQQEINIPD